MLNIFSALPELLRQMPLSVRAAGGRTCPPVRTASKWSGREKSLGICTPKHNKTNQSYVFSKDPNQISCLIHQYFFINYYPFFFGRLKNKPHTFFLQQRWHEETHKPRKEVLCIQLPLSVTISKTTCTVYWHRGNVFP